MNQMTYCQIDVLSLNAKTLRQFEDSVSGVEHSKVPGYDLPVPTAMVELVPRQLSEGWEEDLENLSCNTVNDYRTLVELEPDQWPDPDWRLVNEQVCPIHCTRYFFQPASHRVPTEHFLAASRRFPELRFGLCWMTIDDLSGEIAEQEIRGGVILEKEVHLQEAGREAFARKVETWLGLLLGSEEDLG